MRESIRIHKLRTSIYSMIKELSHSFGIKISIYLQRPEFKKRYVKRDMPDDFCNESKKDKADIGEF